MPTEKEKLQKDIAYWREEAVLAEEQGDEEQARKYSERVEALQQRLDSLSRTPPRPTRR